MDINFLRYQPGMRAAHHLSVFYYYYYYYYQISNFCYSQDIIASCYQAEKIMLYVYVLQVPARHARCARKMLIFIICLH